MHHSLYINFLRLHPLVRIFLITVTIIVLFGGIIHLIEPENFPTVFEGIWWAIITASTVGYGDYVPTTTLGRLVAMILLFFGAGFISAYFINLATTAITKQNHFSEGKLAFHGENHIIIVGWNERSREIIQKLIQRGFHHTIVLIDETLKENPVKEKSVRFLKGRATKDDVLLQANIKEAQKIIITADQHRDEYQADMNSILTLIAVKGVCPEIKCLIEILTTEQVNNAKRAGADTIIETNQIISKHMVENTVNDTLTL